VGLLRGGGKRPRKRYLEKEKEIFNLMRHKI
jgi:hypothetical protein